MGDSLLRMCENYQRRQFPEAAYSRALVANARGAYLVSTGKFDDAKAALVSSLRHITDARGGGSLPAIQALRRMVQLYQRSGEPAKAEQYRVKLAKVTEPR